VALGLAAGVAPMKRRELMERGATAGAVAAAGAWSLLGSPARAASPRRLGPRWGSFDTPSLTMGPVNVSLRDWWEEHHSGGRFEERFLHRLNHCRVGEWENTVRNRIVVDGMIHAELTGFTKDGNCLIHPEVGYRHLSTAPLDLRLRWLQVLVYGPEGAGPEQCLSVARFACLAGEWVLEARR
jgi:hypothetical protein